MFLYDIISLLSSVISSDLFYDYLIYLIPLAFLATVPIFLRKVFL